MSTSQIIIACSSALVTVSQSVLLCSKSSLIWSFILWSSFSSFISSSSNSSLILIKDFCVMALPPCGCLCAALAARSAAPSRIHPVGRGGWSCGAFRCASGLVAVLLSDRMNSRSP